MASYPTSIASFATHNTGDTIAASDVNNPNAEIVAVETGLLNGTAHNVKPLSDNTYDLGTASLAWKNLWTKGTTQFNGVAYTWPGADGSANQVLQTNGSKTLNWATVLSTPIVQEFRLTLSTGNSFTTSDVTGATTLYFSPHVGRRCTTFDSSGNATVLTSAEISIAVPATTSQMYDVFVFNSSGTLTLELLAWTNDTTRATAIVKTGGADSAGVYTKSGDSTRRYVGSFRTTTVSGQTEDSALNRYVWNYYNRVERLSQRFESATSWTYATNTIRQANANASNQVNFIIGVSEDVVIGRVGCTWFSSTSSNNVAVMFGLDSTTTAAGNQIIGVVPMGGNLGGCSYGDYVGFPGNGKHSLVWLEDVTTNSTVTFYAGGQTVINTLTLAQGVQAGINVMLRG